MAVELAGQTAMLAGKRGARQARQKGASIRALVQTESQRKRGGRGDCGAGWGCGADTAVAPVLGGGQVEAGDRPLGALLAPLRSGGGRGSLSARFRLGSQRAAWADCTSYALVGKPEPTWRFASSGSWRTA